MLFLQTSARFPFVGNGWEFDRERILLDPVSWTANHVDAHAEAARLTAARLSSGLGGTLASEIERTAASIGEESAGRMYSVALRVPEQAGSKSSPRDR